MSRLNNIHLVYLIVKEFEKQLNRPVTHIGLKNLIKRKLGCTDEAAEKYISDLVNGITIEGELYKIIFYNGGYQCEMKTKTS